MAGVAGALAIGLAGSAPDAMAVDAAAAQAIYRANSCASCHTIDRRLVGPAYRDIAAKYKNDPGAAARLERVVKYGGSGVWGVIPMPSHPRMSDADIRTVVDWILAGAPAK
ncbi:MAG: c-type cytochrome [Pararobbsia sp.]